jgi:hypothetical protein
MKRSRELEEDLDSDSEQTNAEPPLRPVSKVTQLESAIGDEEDTIAMRCNLPPHKEPLAFSSYDEYEVHYNKSHTNRCLECHKNFPSEHLLNVHIEEYHDPLVIVKREQGEHTVCPIPWLSIGHYESATDPLRSSIRASSRDVSVSA